MRLHVLSDLQLEFLPFLPPRTNADVVILAGDIAVEIQGLQWAALESKRVDGVFAGKQIVFVPGNHEYYGGDWDTVPGRLRGAAREMGIHYLDVGETVIDGVRFLGCNLWTDFELFGDGAARRAECLAAAARYLVDYRVIKREGRALLPEETRTLHLAQRTCLRESYMHHSAGRSWW